MKFILLKNIYMCIYWTSIKRTNLTNNLNDKQDSTPCTQYMVTNGKDLFTRAEKKNAQENPPLKKKRKTPDNIISKSNCTADWNIFAILKNAYF